MQKSEVLRYQDCALMKLDIIERKLKSHDSKEEFDTKKIESTNKKEEISSEYAVNKKSAIGYYFSGLAKYATFRGRARRKEFWYYALFNGVFAYSFIILFSFVSLEIAISLYILFLLITFLPGFAISVRRMHDVGKSGWYLLIPIYSLILACKKGDIGENKYGPDPKQRLNPKKN
jgi:uncharacterized membrane protein YhaH (DUF805 family)